MHFGEIFYKKNLAKMVNLSYQKALPGPTVFYLNRASLSELGVLELWCMSHEEGRQWKLEFDIRHEPAYSHTLLRQ
jgi:hypothetical protein